MKMSYFHYSLWLEGHGGLYEGGSCQGSGIEGQPVCVSRMACLLHVMHMMYERRCRQTVSTGRQSAIMFSQKGPIVRGDGFLRDPGHSFLLDEGHLSLFSPLANRSAYLFGGSWMSIRVFESRVLDSLRIEPGKEPSLPPFLQWSQRVCVSDLYAHVCL